MTILENISLKNYNTFGIDVKAKRFVNIHSIVELQKLLSKEKDLFLLSGGSNMLLTHDIEKLVVHIDIKGISIENENENSVEITVNAGENWHEFVLWCVENNYGGIENLSLIPGKVGTCPIQNIGAYGIEVKDTITKVSVVEIETGKINTFTNEECKFGYRDSIFKNDQKDKFIIVTVSFRLSKKNHVFHTSYGAIEAELTTQKIGSQMLKNISEAVISIRKSKLPDPRELGNSGSFFKNPLISSTHFEKLQLEFPTIPNFKISETVVKIPAGWLIEQAGFKGKHFGNCGVHEKQALVLVNYGNATGVEILNLAKKIQKTILEKFQIELEIEVNIIS